MGKYFIPVTEISVSTTEISVTFSYEHIEIFTKEIGVRRDIGNRASSVNRAHMKRPWIAPYVRQTPISWGSHRLSGERISLLFWKFSFYRAFYEMIFPKRKLFNSANSIGCERTRFSYAENFAQIVGLSYFSFKTKSRQLCEQQHILSPFPFHLQTFPRV